jgi:hypothetical protein
MRSLLPAPYVSLFAAAMLLAGGAGTARGQSALDGFNTDPDGAVNIFVAQPDGKILIAGNFNPVSFWATRAVATGDCPLPRLPFRPQRKWSLPVPPRPRSPPFSHRPARHSLAEEDLPAVAFAHDQVLLSFQKLVLAKS